MSERNVNIQGDSERNVIIAGDGNVININTARKQSHDKNPSADPPSEISDKKPLIFLCYAAEDKTAVRSLYEKLKQAGFNPWMDVVDILPGMEPDHEIRQAVKRTDFVLVCLSEISVRKRGYLNKEIKWASDRQDEMLPGDIFMIPVNLETCELPDHLSHWQAVDLFETGGFERLIKALKYQLGKLHNNFIRNNDISNLTKVKDTVTILFLAANPSDTTRLRLDTEIREIGQALQQSEFRYKFDIRQHWAVRISDLQSCILRHKPDVLHFSGHGEETGEIFLENNSGGKQPVSIRAMSQLFSVLKDNIRCVVLNACYSEKQAAAIAEHIDCVIGMSDKIGDVAAISFSTSFYQALGYGRNIKEAFDLGCVQIDLANLSQQDIPKLLCRKGVDPAGIYLVCS